MPGGSEAVTWISPIRYIEPFLRRRAFALSWRAVALMTTSARIPGSIRSTMVRAPRPAVARPLFTFACVAGVKGGGPGYSAGRGGAGRGRRGEAPRRGAQWWQAPGAPSDSAVRNEEPHPHAATALGLLTVKPAPISVST